jgi:hypothetical protein
MKNIIIIPIILTIAQGCTSIQQPTASRALVENQHVASEVVADLSLSAALSNLKVGAALTIEQRPAVMGDSFFAATGLTCRKLTWQHVEQNIYCLNPQGHWFKVKRVIAEYNENDMSGISL